MNYYDHLPLSPHHQIVSRQPKAAGGRGYEMPEGRNKINFSQHTSKTADEIVNSFKSTKNKFSSIIDPSLIFEIEINQSVDINSFEKSLLGMGIHIISIAEKKKGYWVVFSDDDELNRFRQKLLYYDGSKDGYKYEFFHAISTIRDIPKEEKIGPNLLVQPLESNPEYIDIEFWPRITEKESEKLIEQIKNAYRDDKQFRITDRLITKSFVLIRVKITKSVLESILELKDTARVDRPFIPSFHPGHFMSIDSSKVNVTGPSQNATGILIIDSGIISNHPLLEKCIGGAGNFQTCENFENDVVGHGTAIAGCAAYGNIEQCIDYNEFIPSNWIYSAKVMFGVKNTVNGQIDSEYDNDKLIENQLSDAIESFIINSDYNIQVVNISLGNMYEVWHKTFHRQLPLASLIDELAKKLPNVLFIVSAGNQHPQNIFSSIEEVKQHYPDYIFQLKDYKIINPATSALAITVGSIANAPRIANNGYDDGKIHYPIADKSQPSPFTRSGPGINGMVKPELVEYGGNMIFHYLGTSIREDIGGKIALLNNNISENLIKFGYGTSFSASKIAHTAGRIANEFPEKSANFISNLLISSASYPFVLPKDFYKDNNGKSEMKHLNICGYGVPSFDKAIKSQDNRTVLIYEGKLQINKVKVFSINLPEIFFNTSGRKRISVTLTFLPETRSTRGDSYISNKMVFHLFHTVTPDMLLQQYGVMSLDVDPDIPKALEKYEINLFPGINTRSAGCHQKAWKEYQKKPNILPNSLISIVLLNINKWIQDENYETSYCLSIVLEHEQEINLYNELRANIQTRARVR